MQVFIKRTVLLAVADIGYVIAAEVRQSTDRVSTPYSKDDYVKCKLNLHDDNLVSVELGSSVLIVFKFWIFRQIIKYNCVLKKQNVHIVA